MCGLQLSGTGHLSLGTFADYYRLLPDKHLLRYITVTLPDHRGESYSQGGVVFVSICIAVKKFGLA